MIQIKKIFFSLLLLLMLFPFSVQAKESPIEEKINANIVDQKSVIDEQQITELNLYTSLINTLTVEEKELICRIVWREAGNQCVDGQRAVIEIILNRLLSDKYPNTILEILSQPHQFSTWKDKDKVTSEQILQMQQILNLVYLTNNTILNYNYLYFNCEKPNKDEYIKIQNQWFWV